MCCLSTRWKLAVVGFCAYVGFAWYFGGDVPGQRKVVAQEEDKPAEKKDGLKPMYYGVAACANPGCHESPPAKWLKGKDLLCRCTEAVDWHKKDKHADAYRVLTGPRGKQMAKILGYDVTDPKGRGKACLVCHGVVIEDEKLLEASKENQFDIAEGVNCVACHGPYTEWIGRHGVLVNAQAWRPKTRKEKEEQGGMRDLWDPMKRAELCVSCHVGNVKEGKFVTHEMYAAGHPPLPGFEAATFSDEMPRHWQYLREKKPPLQKELGYKAGEQEQAKLILVSAAVSLRETMDLLEQQAKKCQTAKDDDNKALDLSNFDCYACHHDLKAPSWRQKRGYPGKPGRVPMRPWPIELIKLAIKATATNAAGKVDSAAETKALAGFDGALANVHKGFDARPFGDPKKIEAAAAALKGWADALAKKLNAVTIDSVQARTLLTRIPDLYRGSEKDPLLVDYDSARQVAWSFEVMYNELNGKKGDPKIRKTLTALDEQLKLRLPKGRDKIVEDELKESLEKRNDYDPGKFRKLLIDLSAALKE
jgi:hypothetical protein